MEFFNTEMEEEDTQMEEADTVPKQRRKIRMMMMVTIVICLWQQDGKRICKARGMIRKRAEMPGRQCQCWAFEWEGCEIKVTCKYHLPVECM